jgi:hypothetical protein
VTSGHATLHDMFLSHQVTAVRASILHCPETHICMMFLLHCLDVSSSTNMGDLKVKLLHHLINEDCYAVKRVAHLLTNQLVSA